MAYLIPIFFSKRGGSLSWNCWNCDKNNNWMEHKCKSCGAPENPGFWLWFKVKILRMKYK